MAALLAVLAIARGVLHYLEQRTNHYIAFRLLAHVRDLVFGALRRLAPAKLAGADRGSLVSTVTADVELLEVFFAHTVSPVAIAILTSVVMVCFQARLNPWCALLATLAYVVVGAAVPLVTSKLSGTVGREVRDGAADLSGFVLDGLHGLSEVLQYGAGMARLQELDSR
ncbi:MAG: ABC transporter ATP-binding protein, partial [Atopobiaceae bacterium]|nr:ABC transporter ATP-binding protein [Atopobiaceae bacterium]